LTVGAKGQGVVDMIDGTPVLDIKPYLTGFAARGDIVEL
jgi:tRNA (Thr-GGU) A37 N-methylase